MREKYRGRLAPSPTGYLHIGHIRTFEVAMKRAREENGILVLRIEDLDRERCRDEYERAIYEDLKYFGFVWQEGPDVGGEFGPYRQSERMELYRKVWRELKKGGFLFPCWRSRRDMEEAPRGPHGNEVVYPVEWRPAEEAALFYDEAAGMNWRFRVPIGRRVEFVDGRVGNYSALAGKDFGDFPVWRKDDVPAYELAVVVDDWAMRITEVVRGEDLLLSTCRQLLIYEAMGWEPPAFYHVPLVLGTDGRKLSKRDGASRAAYQARMILEKSEN
ncbi:MAG: glutamate--tRNA ligase family protein [Chthoniobacterales bacterium]|nr:glutamate--tRNA ligase family protein [Chthoniobacterales bacterium]MCX7712583.1 glutamate--tRNA ligase family protein [Chthoniobacterales bacterium]